MQAELLEWNFWHGAELSVGAGFSDGVGSRSGLSLSKYFGPISGLHTKLFYNIKGRPNDFFSFVT